MLEVGTQNSYWHTWGDPEGSCERYKNTGIEAIDFGFPGVDHKAEPLTSFYDKSIEEIIEVLRPIKEAFDKYGMKIVQSHAPFPLWVKDKPHFNEYMVMVMDKICDACVFLGCPAIVAHGIGRTNHDVEWQTNIDMYTSFIPSAKRTGVKICLENLFGSFHDKIVGGTCSSPEEAVKYIDTLNGIAGADCFGFCLDTGHANLISANIRQYINILGHRLTCLHIHDNDGTEDSHMLPYTQRHKWGLYSYFDWEAFIAGLRDINYRGPLCFETFRVMQVVPREVLPETVALTTAMGRYFRDRILAPEEEAAK